MGRPGHPLTGGAFLVARLALDDEVPTAVPVAVGAVLAALSFLLLRRVKVTATISDGTHLTAQEAFRSNAIALTGSDTTSSTASVSAPPSGRVSGSASRGGGVPLSIQVASRRRAEPAL